MSTPPRRRGAHAAPRTRSFATPPFSTARPRHGRLVPKPLTALVLGAAGGGFALLAVLGPGPVSVPERPAALLVANAAVQPAALDTRSPGNERASRSRRAAAPDPEPVPARRQPVPVPARPRPEAPVLPGCEDAAHDTAGYANGRLPARVLCTLPGGWDERLRADAAISFVRLAAAYQAALGQAICVSDGYRTLGEQQQLRRVKRRLAARPGSSEHGWGLAVDLSCGVQSFRTRQHAWMVQNAGRYGWFLPDWARRGGARPEPWHWEYAGSAS